MLSGTFTLRKNANNLTADDLVKVLSAYGKAMKLNDNRSYKQYAGFHGIPNFYCWHGPQDKDGWPDVRLFLPWHRAYLYRFEKALQDLEPSVTIPWWDWRSTGSGQDKVPDIFSAEKIDDKPNPLYKFHINIPESNLDRDTMRFQGESVSDPVSLPTLDEIDHILNIPDNHFDEFSDALEDVHGRVHIWTGGNIIRDGQPVSGDMAQIPYAAFDPIFWSHHCMIDRIWWQWQRKNGINEIPDHYRKMSLEPFGMTVDEVLDIYNLGYDYVGDETSTGGNWSRR